MMSCTILLKTSVLMSTQKLIFCMHALDQSTTCSEGLEDAFIPGKTTVCVQDGEAIIVFCGLEYESKCREGNQSLMNAHSGGHRQVFPVNCFHLYYLWMSGI